MSWLYDVINLIVTVVCFLVVCLVTILHIQRRYATQLKRYCFKQNNNQIRSVNRATSISSSASDSRTAPLPTPTATSHNTTTTNNNNNNNNNTNHITGSTWKKSNINSDLKRKQRWAEILTAINIACTLSMVGVSLWVRLGFFHLTPSKSHCPSVVISLTILYTSIRCTLYCIFINRVDVAFNGTIYAYNHRTIKICYTIVVCVLSTIIIWSFFAVKSASPRKRYARDGSSVSKDENRAMRSCQSIIDVMFSVFILMFDICFIAIMVRMFVVPLRQLFAQSNDDISNSNGGTSVKKKSGELSAAQVSDLELKLLPVKYSVVSLVSVLTTSLALCMLVTSGFGLFMTVDNTLNIVCLLMLLKEWTIEYWKICGPLLRSLHRIGLVNETTHLQLASMSDFFAHNEQQRLLNQRVRSSHRVMTSDDLILKTQTDFASDYGNSSDDNQTPYSM